MYERTAAVVDPLLGAERFRSSPAYASFLLAFAALLALPLLYLGAKFLNARFFGGEQRRGPGWAWLWWPLLLAVLLLKPFMLLRAYVPVYKQMRWVAYLFSAFPPFAMAATRAPCHAATPSPVAATTPMTSMPGL